MTNVAGGVKQLYYSSGGARSTWTKPDYSEGGLTEKFAAA
jgi:hypothetical protein